MSSHIDPESHTDRLGRVVTHDLGRISRREVRRYARSVKDDNALFHDVEAARDAGYDDLVVPPNFLSAIIEYGEGAPTEDLREDGIDPDRFPIDLPADAVLLGGGQDLRVDRYVVAGEALVREETFTDLYQKQSQMGTLTFVETSATFTVEGERVLHCEETMIVGDRS